MSVIVKNIVKEYGTQKAVNNVSFEAKPGQILGFLGPNGAGKTTTMKIITSFIPATSGEVQVCGDNVAEKSMETRKKIGYLPEHNPLYLDMYVKEYLGFVGKLHKIDSVKSRVAEMIELTGLQREQHKKIQTLSKGYRQRVGLAQAMIHDPKVLILDEPTSGLDPNQLAEIRALIRKLGEEKTVIFSTHIMQEVQALCDRAVIINKGNLVANDSIEELKRKMKGRKTIELTLLKGMPLNGVEQWQGVSQVVKVSENVWRIESKGQEDFRERLFTTAVEQNRVILEMKQLNYNMEEVFQELTNAKG